MAKSIDYVDGVTVVPASWLNGIQEVLSGLSIGVIMERANGTALQLVPIDDGDDSVAGQSSVIIDGDMCWWRSTITVTVTGTAGTYGVYVVGGSEELTATNIVIAASAPASSRKIGTVVWSGTEITLIEQDGVAGVTGAMLLNGALASSSSIEWERLPGGARVPKLKAGGVGAANLGAESVGEEKIAAASVSVAKLAASVVEMLFRPGMIIAAALSTAPAGWLACEGQAVERAKYAALFAEIGTKYGPGDGSTTFNLPSFVEKIPMGKGPSAALGTSGGEKTHTLIEAEFPPHIHGVNDPGHVHGVNDPGHVHGVNDPGHVHPTPFTNFEHWTTSGPQETTVHAAGSTGSAFTGLTIQSNVTGLTVQSKVTGLTVQSKGGGGAHNNLQPYQTVTYLIKT